MKNIAMYIKSITGVLSVFKIASIVFVLLAMVGVLIGIARNMYQEDELREQYVCESMRKTTYNYKLQVNRYINNKKDVLTYMQTFPEIYNMDQSQQKDFIMNRSQYLGFRHMFVMHKNGNCFYIEENVVRNQKNEQFYDDTMMHDVFLTKPWSDPKRFFSIITLCVSIKNPQGEKVGVLCGALDLSKIQDFIGANESVGLGEYVLINEKGQYISGSRVSARTIYNNKNYFEQEESQLDVVKRAVDKKEDSFGKIKLDNITYYAYAAYMPEYDWTVIQYIEADTIDRQMHDVSSLQYMLAFLSLLLFVTVCRIAMRWVKTNQRLFLDHLTGCQNRLAYEMRLDSLENNYDNDIAVVYMDLNKFKMVNDTFGHDNGDLLLKLFAETLNEVFSHVGTVYRVGGDEFVCIILNEPQEVIEECCQKINEILAKKSKSLTFDYVMSSSYGYAIREKGCQDAMHLVLERSDRSMYHYKHAWRRRNGL